MDSSVLYPRLHPPIPTNRRWKIKRLLSKIVKKNLIALSKHPIVRVDSFVSDQSFDVHIHGVFVKVSHGIERSKIMCSIWTYQDERNRALNYGFLDAECKEFEYRAFKILLRKLRFALETAKELRWIVFCLSNSAYALKLMKNPVDLPKFLFHPLDSISKELIPLRKSLKRLKEEVTYEELKETHVKLGHTRLTNLDEIYWTFQVETRFSEETQQKFRLIAQCLCLEHTAMSKGDIVLFPLKRKGYVVSSSGFFEFTFNPK